MDRICLAQFGIYDLPSLGDTMFPAIFADNMKKIWGNDNIEIDIYSPTSCDKPYNNLPKVHSIDELKERNEIKHYDAFILGGGEFIHFDDVRYKTVDGAQREYTAGELWLKPTRLAHELGIPVYWEGVGVSYDFVEEYQRKTIREVCEFVERITVRDEYSAQRLLDAGVEKDIYVSPDMLWMFKNSITTSELDNTYNKLANEYDFLKKPYMIVQYATEYRREEVADEAVKFSKEHGLVPVSLVVNYCHDDTKLCEEFTNYDPSFKTADRMLQPIEIMTIIYKSCFFWGSSFHGNLISMLYGVPNIILDMYPNTVSKMDGLMSWLDCVERRCIFPKALGRVSNELLIKKDISSVEKQASDLCDQEYAHIKSLSENIVKRNNKVEFVEKPVKKQSLSYKGYVESKDDFQIAIATKKADGTFEFDFKGSIEKDSRFILYSKDFSLINACCGGSKLPLKNGGVTIDKGAYTYGRSEFALPEIDSKEAAVIAFIERVSSDEYDEALKIVINNKEGHIEQLLQSERDLKESVLQSSKKCEDLTTELEELRVTLRNKEGHIEQLLQSERDLTNQLNEELNMKLTTRIINKLIAR